MRIDRDRMMKKKEIVRRQSDDSPKRFYLLREGGYYEAYDECAVILSRLLRYKLRYVKEPSGLEYYVVRFPVDRLELVAERIALAGGEVFGLRILEGRPVNIGVRGDLYGITFGVGAAGLDGQLSAEEEEAAEQEARERSQAEFGGV